MSQPFNIPAGVDPVVIQSLLTYVTNGRDQLLDDADRMKGTSSAYILSEIAESLDVYKKALESYDFMKGTPTQ